MRVRQTPVGETPADLFPAFVGEMEPVVVKRWQRVHKAWGTVPGAQKPFALCLSSTELETTAAAVPAAAAADNTVAQGYPT